MKLSDRLAYCRRQIADHAMSDHDWPAWLAEHDGLKVGAGLLEEVRCPAAYSQDARLQQWFQRGVEDGRVLRSLEESQKIVLDTQERPC